MKKLLFLYLISFNVAGQIFVQNETTGSITITPKGIQDSKPQNITTNVVLGPSSFIENTQGNNNTAIGHASMSRNEIGSYNTAIGSSTLTYNIWGNSNTAIGYTAFYNNTTGFRNTATGSGALSNNREGNNNTANGLAALSFNRTGNYNTATGVYSMASNFSGYYNTANGGHALYSNTTGYRNTANGNEALYSNTTGKVNVADGQRALYSNTVGIQNTASGAFTGQAIIEGKNNTFIGFYADATADLSNATAIGANAKVDASNKVRIGDSTVTVIEGQVPWSNPSDRRLKENILYTNRLGLDFINRLQTVSYNYIADGNKVRYDGFIAQDIEKVMKDLNLPFSGLKKSDNGTYSLAYSDFVMPLVNAVKELNDTNKNQQAQIDNLTKKNEMLAASIEEIKARLLQMENDTKSKPETK
ncbi:tail fiber domain-containing protein [Emticicia fontis]